MPDSSPAPDRATKLRNLALAALSLIAVGSIGMFAVRTFRPPAPTSGLPVETTTPQVTPNQMVPNRPGSNQTGSSQTGLSQTGPNQTAGPAGQATTAPGTAPVGSVPDTAPVPPSFDIVRIDPQGDAVIAGRSQPGAELSIRSDGVEIGHATADGQGAWALTLPLPAGPHALTLQEHTASGQEVASAGSVLMAVPERGPPGALPPLAVLTGPQQPPRVLQGPPGAGATKPGQLGLGALDYDARGDLQLSGTAKPDTTVRLYADNHPIGEVHTGKDGRWVLAPRTVVPEGPHQLRLDQVGPDGKVIARVELPFHRELIPPGDLAAGRVIVQPGTTLWRIASQAYGRGIRYTVIYQANHEQIRNPNLIYPGQVFAVPPGSDGAASPASSNTSR